jgi:hypothetical protein
MVRRDSPPSVALSNPKNDGAAGAIVSGPGALPRFWVDDVDGIAVGPVEKTAGSRTSTTPQSTPRARRSMIREPVTALSSYCFPSLSLPHD